MGEGRMKHYSADLVVIGGGSTGVGIARDAAMRGLSVVLVDKGDLGSGTTGRFHGQLHSGGRYVVSDMESAIECARENHTLRHIHSDAIEDCGGMFTLLSGDNPAYADQWIQKSQEIGLPFQEISCKEAFRREPRLSPTLARAALVEEGSIDSWKMVWGAAHSAQAYGATVLRYHQVTDMVVTDGTINTVICHDLRHDEQANISCAYVANAAGPWAGKIAALAQCFDVDVVCGRGVMIAMNHRLVNTVINRWVWPGDGGTLVPAHSVCIIGTTDVVDDDPDHLAIPRVEVEQMLDSGEELIPGFRKARALRAWAGARPLLHDKRVADDDTRHMSRGMSIIDHEERDGIQNFVSIIGGKLSTYRLMAEKVTDILAKKANNHALCRTASEPVPEARAGSYYALTSRFKQREIEGKRSSSHSSDEDSLDNQIICECELVTRKMILDALSEDPEASFDDLRRRLRVGMGPCQGGFCSQRIAGLSVENGFCNAAEATARLRDFLARRWKGVMPVAHGQQAREMALDSWIHDNTLDIPDLLKNQ